MQLLLACFGCFVPNLVGLFANFVVLIALFAIAAAGFFVPLALLQFEPNFDFALFGS